MTPADRDALRALLAAKAHAQAFLDATPSRLIGTDEYDAACVGSVRADHAADYALGNAAPALLDALDAAERERHAIIAAAYPDQPDAAATVPEVCEQIGALHDAADSYAASLATVTAERDEALGWKPLAMSEGKRAAATRAMLDVIEARLSTERDTAEAALVALYGAADAWGRWCETHHGDDYLTQPSRGLKMAFDAALSTKRADLAARVMARHRAEALREAASKVRGKVPGPVTGAVADMLDDMAAEAERAK